MCAVFLSESFLVILIVIIFRIQVEAFVNHKSILENKFWVNVQVFGENESMSTDYLCVNYKNDCLMNTSVLFVDKALSLNTVELLFIWPKLCSLMFYELKTIKTLSSCPKEKARVEKLCDAVKNLCVGSKTMDIYIFGSRLYNLATENSNVDLYVNTSKITKTYLIIFMLN